MAPEKDLVTSLSLIVLSEKLIKEHIKLVEKIEYGKGKYKLFDNNCEHFATICVYGLGMSQQAKSKIGDTDYLLQAIQESNEFFKELEKELDKNKKTTESNGKQSETRNNDQQQ
ncbi:12881_t:CDS:1, partial [Funneliformis geosporum]